MFTEKAVAEGKPAERIPGIVEGQIRKNFYQRVVLLEQEHIRDENKASIAKVVEAAAKAAGKPIRLAGFVRFALGEGIDKGPSDFGGEVAALVG